MNVKREPTCILCPKVTKSVCTNVDETMRLMLDILLLRLDVHITRDPIVCQDCVEVAKKCLDFKYTCVNTERDIVSSSVAVKKAKLDIRVICKERVDVEAVVDENFNICRFCMTQFGRNHFASLDILMNDSIAEILSGYLPEMDFNIIMNPIICSTCRDNLDHYSKFIRTCRDLPHFFIKSNLGCSDTYSQMMVKQESITVGHTGTVHLNGYSELLQVEESDVKEEGILIVKTDEKLLESMLDQYCARYPNKEIDEIGSMYKCSLCTYRTKRNRQLKTHMLIHKDIVETELFKCSLCSYEAKQKSQLKRHMLVHKDVSEIEMFKCPLCTYETKKKFNIEKHMLVHKDVSEIEMFKCSLCTFETKQKYNLKRHMLIHQNVSEIKIFKCPLCTYESNKKFNLKKHMLVHKDISEIEMYKCSRCTYEAKQKGNLIRHMLIHQDVSELEMFKCSLCSYEAKQKVNLKSHMFIHKDVSEIEMFKCPLCTYEAKQKCKLLDHMIVHKDVSEMEMFKCPLCTFEAKQKRYLKKHMLIHIRTFHK